MSTLKKRYCLRHCGLGGMGAVQVVDHHEVVDHRRVADLGHRDSSVTQSSRVPLAFITQHVGLGVAIIPTYAPMNPALVNIRELRDHHLTWTMSLATGTRRAERKIVRAFAELVEHVFSQRGRPNE
jgi:DNA-binding transcriptional LysR family regulator